MRGGRMADEGKPDGLIAPGPLREVFDLDTAVHYLDRQRIGTYFTKAGKT